MKLKEKFKLFMKSVFTSFGAVISEEGQQIIWDGEGDIAEGMSVYMEQENENGELEYVAVPDGEYKVEEKIIVVAEGKVSEIRAEEKVEEEPAQMEEETPAAPAAPADPTTEEVITTEDEPFDAEKAYEELKSMFDALRAEVDMLKEQLGKVLEIPAEEDAFSAAKKNEEVEQKHFMCKAAHK